MKVVTEGHNYLLSAFEGTVKGTQQIQFIEKKQRKEVPELYKPDTDGDELITINDGTTNEEVLSMLIDRLNYLNKRFPCRENSIVITHLDTALLWLEKRTRDRIKRDVEGKAQL